MSRLIQPTQIVTYKKKISFQNPENTKVSFWAEFFKTLAIQVVAVALGIATAGIGTAIVAPLGFSQLGIATTSFFIQTTINFGVNQIYDELNGRRSTTNTLMNLLFAITDIGQFGRALKYDKLLKLANQSNIFKKVGINFKVKNFYQIKQHVLLKDVLIGKTKFAFKKSVTDIEIINMISVLVTPQTKSALKKLSFEQLETYIQMQKTLHKINPKLISFVKKSEIADLDLILKKYKNIGVDDFFKMNDIQATNLILELSGTKFGLQKIVALNNARIQSKFQETFFEMFMRYKKLLKTQIDRINPVKIVNKIVNKIFEPITKQIANLKKATVKILGRWDKIAKNLIKKLNLIPCHPDAFLLGFKFEPITVSGDGFCTIYKKPYVSKKTGRLSNYNPVRVWTNLIEVEQFALQPDGNSQSIWYNQNWALGFGFGQNKKNLLNLISPGLQKIINQSNKFFKTIQTIQKIGVVSFLKSVGNRSSKKIGNIFENKVNSIFKSLINVIPGSQIYTSTIIKTVNGKKITGKNASAGLTSVVRKKIKKVKIIHV